MNNGYTITFFLGGQEEAFRNWCGEHKDGFVMNYISDKPYLLHSAGCGHLLTPVGGSHSLQDYLKMCSGSREGLLAQIERELRLAGKPEDAWEECAHCVKAGRL